MINILFITRFYGRVVCRFSTHPVKLEIKYFLQKYESVRFRPKIRNMQQNTLFLKNKGKRDWSVTDNLWCPEFNTLSVVEKLFLLTKLAEHDCDNLKHSQFYKKFIEQVSAGLWKQTTWNQLIPMMFFVGQLKSVVAAKSLTINCLHRANTLFDPATSDFEDLCILGNAAYKNSTFVTSPEIIKTSVNLAHGSMSHFIGKDNGRWIVMLVKTLSSERFIDYSFLDKLSTVLKNTTKDISVAGQVYVLVYCAIALYYDKELLDMFSGSIIKVLQSNLKARPVPVGTRLSLYVRPRTRDISRYLWALSSLNYKLSEAVVREVIIPNVKMRFDNLEFVSSMHEFVSITSSLFMMGYLDKFLIHTALTTTTLSHLKGKPTMLRHLSRFAFLLERVFHEVPQLITSEMKNVKHELDKIELITPDWDKYLKTRPTLSVALDKFNKLQHSSVSGVRMDCPVPKLYIAGVSLVVSGLHVHVDVLDNTNLLYKSDSVDGSLSLKIRLLAKENVAHVLMSKHEIESAGFQEMFLSKLNNGTRNLN